MAKAPAAKAATPSASIAPVAPVAWVKMSTGLSGPALSLAPGDDHPFEPTEARRLVDAGFGKYTDAPAA